MVIKLENELFEEYWKHISLEYKYGDFNLDNVYNLMRNSWLDGFEKAKEMYLDIPY